MSREEQSAGPTDTSDDLRTGLVRVVRHLRLRLEAEGRAGLAAVARPAEAPPAREALAPDEDTRDRKVAARTVAAREDGEAAAAGREGGSEGDTSAARRDRAGEAVENLKKAFAEAAPDDEARPAAAVAGPAAPAHEAGSSDEDARDGKVAGRQDTPTVGVKGPGLFDALRPDLEDGSSPEEALRRIADEVAACERCPDLAANRTLTVPGQGDPRADLMFIGEGPGAEEDRQGLAFVGRAGQLLTKMIEAIGMRREEVFIANIIKCRPPDNRKPAPEEEANCSPYLARQIEVIRPKVIVALGGTAAQYLLQTHDGITRLRGRFYPYMGARLMPTFHPAYVLRNYTKDTRRKVYDDLLAAKEALAEGQRPPGDG